MKEHELTYEKPIINLQALIFIALIILVGWFYLSPIFIKEKPIETPIIKNESKAIQIEYITVMVTPIPDGKLYFANEFSEGIRKIQNPFTFYTNNASGKKDMVVKSFVYDYKRLPYLTWHNDNDNQNYHVHPHEGYDYLIVYYAMYLDNRIADSVSYSIPSLNNFIVSDIDKSSFYYAVDMPAHINYIELEHSYDFNNAEIAEYFGQRVSYSRRLNDKETAGIISIKEETINAGKSNAESGYIIYTIPKDIPDDRLIAGINFGENKRPWWKLVV